MMVFVLRDPLHSCDDVRSVNDTLTLEKVFPRFPKCSDPAVDFHEDCPPIGWKLEMALAPETCFTEEWL